MSVSQTHLPYYTSSPTIHITAFTFFPMNFMTTTVCVFMSISIPDHSLLSIFILWKSKCLPTYLDMTCPGISPASFNLNNLSRHFEKHSTVIATTYLSTWDVAHFTSIKFMSANEADITCSELEVSGNGEEVNELLCCHK